MARPGPRRDVIEEAINLRGLPIRLIDTAGVRESDDEIEREGMKRTQQELARADLALHVFDASQPPPGQADAQALAVLNKTDLGEHAGWRAVEGVRISCLQGQGIEALAEAIV